jgi:hypothetical protein
VDVVGCDTFCSGFISMFVCDILQIPSGQDNSRKFDILLTVHLSIILATDQLNAQILVL